MTIVRAIHRTPVVNGNFEWQSPRHSKYYNELHDHELATLCLLRADWEDWGEDGDVGIASAI